MGGCERSRLVAGDLPECWIPPGHVLEARAVVRLYKDLLDERGAWHQRIAATLFHQGVPVIGSMATAEGRAAVEQVDLSPAGRQAVQTGLRQVDRLTAELDVLRRQLGMLARRQPGCRALRDAWFGIGPVTAVAIWAELGDVRRFARGLTDKASWWYAWAWIATASARHHLLIRRPHRPALPRWLVIHWDAWTRLLASATTRTCGTPTPIRSATMSGTSPPGSPASASSRSAPTGPGKTRSSPAGGGCAPCQHPPDRHEPSRHAKGEPSRRRRSRCAPRHTGHHRASVVDSQTDTRP
jgi:hypothetical protein